MKSHFSLRPFADPNQSLNLAITGTVTCGDSRLALDYELRGLRAVMIPPLAPTPARKDQLWEGTCFEFFLRVKDSSQYWEFNLSPAGHWNVYHFDGYRQGMQLELALTSLPFRVQRQSDTLLLALKLDLTQLVQVDQPLEMAISAVITLREGQNTYWALRHPGAQADFHQPESFTIQVSPGFAN